MKVSILFPTRNRRDYLAVALASVASQAAEHDAEIVIVEDDAEDAPTRQLAERHGARYLALGRPHGINAARNAAVDASGGELLILLDDDVEVWPGWLDALVAHTGDEAFGGPIRPRLEGSHLRACGREPLPVTALDLGPEDRPAEFVWGANLAIRREAFERVGRFDEALGGAGDEEDWQRRLRAAGGSVGYVAAAGVDHRRTGRDAHLKQLARASYFRGRAARRYGVFRGHAPSLLAESRTLIGCLWHIVRRRCGVGVTMSAHSYGRLAEALDPAPAPPNATDPDYLSGRSGTLGRRGLLVGAAKDARAMTRKACARGWRSDAPPAASRAGACTWSASSAPSTCAPSPGCAASSRAPSTTSRCTSSPPRRTPASGRTSTPRSPPRPRRTPTGC